MQSFGAWLVEEVLAEREIDAPSSVSSDVSSDYSMPEALEVLEFLDLLDPTTSGDGSLENVGIRVTGIFQCSECRQTFDTERARQVHWKCFHDAERPWQD